MSHETLFVLYFRYFLVTADAAVLDGHFMKKVTF